MARGQIAPTSSHVPAHHALHAQAAPLVNASWRMTDALQRLSPTAMQALAASSSGRHLSLLLPPMMFRHPWTDLRLSPPNLQLLSLPALRLGYSKTHAFSLAFAVGPLGR